MSRNCARVRTDLVKREVIEGPHEVLVVAEGFVGLDGDTLYFRPDRGSHGLATYDTEEACLRFTGKVPLKVKLVLHI